MDLDVDALKIDGRYIKDLTSEGRDAAIVRHLVALCREAERRNSNLAWLDVSAAEISGQRFLGAPLWFAPSSEAFRFRHAMTDFSVIRDFESWVYEENARAVAITYARVPDTVLLLLFLGEILTMGVVGYSAGLQGSRGLLTAIVLVIVLGAVLTLLVDLDRPREGFLQVNQQPLVDLLEQVGG